MSPLSNNSVFLLYFNVELNMSLSKVDPLPDRYTKEALIEEYAVTARVHKLSARDVCELVTNSAKQSTFEHAVEQQWLGVVEQLGI